MNLGLNFRVPLQVLGSKVEALAARVNIVFNRQHNPDGTHSNVTATSVTTTSLSAGGSYGGDAQAERGKPVFQVLPVVTHETATTAAQPSPQVVVRSEGNVNITSDADINLSAQSPSTGIGGSVSVLAQRILLSDTVGVVTNQIEIGGSATVDVSAAPMNLLLGQLKFPATQNASTDANTLDDYEEGLSANSWTPALLLGGAATGMTYGSQGGWYTKVGRIVYAVGRFTLTAKGSSTGTATITGLPFTAFNSSPAVSNAGAVVASAMAALTSAPVIRVTNGATVLDIFDYGATGVATLDDTNFTDTSVFTFSIVYLADA